MLDNNVNKNQITFQTVQPEQAQQPQVPMEALQVNPELLQENIQDTYVANRVANTTDDPKGMLKTAMLAIPSWYAIAKLMDKYAEHCRGDYEKTIPGKLGANCDKFSENVKNSSFGKSSFARKLNNTFKSVKKFIDEKIVGKSKLLRAFRDTPSRPELAMVKDQQKGMLGFSATDWSQVAENFVRETHFADDLAAYGATPEQIAAYKTRLSKLSGDSYFKELQEIEYELIKQNTRGGNKFVAGDIADFKTLDKAKRTEILKNAKSYEFGLNDFAEFQKINGNRPENIHRILESAHNSNKKMFSIAYESKPSIWGRFKKFLFDRKVYGSEFSNKMASSLGNSELSPEMAKALRDTGLDKKIPKSALGKFITKYNNIILEGMTNRVAGGKLIAIMQAWFLAEAIYKASKAEGLSDKAKTFAERLIELIAMFACIPPAIMLMHKVGGLQYAGMTKEQVAKYRKNLEAHNLKAMSGGFKTEYDWKVSEQALKKELNAGVKNPFVKLGKRIGRIVSVGLEQIRPYDKKSIGVMKDGKMVYRKGIGQKLKDLLRHPKFGLKQMVGYPMRIGLGMMLIMPFLTKLAVKGSHLIFGKPKHSLLDEEKEAAEKQAKMQAQTQLPPQLQNPQTNNKTSFKNSQVQPVQYDSNGKSTTNMLNKYRNGQNNYQQASNTTINNQNTISKPNEPIRTYVPSPIGVILNGQEDLTAADNAMRRADIAEQEALKALKMN